MKDAEKTKEQLTNELRQLRQRVAELEASEKERKQAERALGKHSHELKERVKELNCLYGICSVVEKGAASLDETLQGIVSLIPPACQYPEVACARINLEDREFVTQNFKETALKQTADIVVRGRRLGAVEVFYLEEKPEADEGPFLKEERNLINAVGLRLGYIVQRKKAEEKIRHLNAVLRAVRNVNQLINKEKDRDRLLQSVCDSLIKTRGYHNAWVAVLDESRRLVAGAEAGLGEHFSPMLQRLERGDLTSCGRSALSQRGIVIIRDPQSTCGDCPLSKNYAGRGAMTACLEYGGKVYGMLSVSVPRDLTADQEEQALFEEVAQDIALAIHGIEQEEERKKTQEALRESEERYRTFLDNLGDVAYETDREGNITYANKMAENLTGLRLADIVGKPFLPLFTEESQRIATDVYQRTLNGESPEYELTSVNGRIGHFKNELLRDKDGKTVAVFGIARDITQRKKAQEALRQEKEMAQKYLEVAAVMMVVIDANKQVTLINRKGCETLGYRREEIVGKNWFDTFLPERLRREVSGVFERLMAGEIEPVEYFENPVLTRSAEERIISWHNSVLTDEKGNIICALSSGQDITERKRAEEALKDSEALYHSLVESLPQNIFRKDAEGKFTFANTNLLSTLGKRLEEVVGKTDFDFYPQELAEKYRTDDKKVLEMGETFEDVEEHHTPHGQSLYVRVVKTPVYDSKGEVRGVQGIFWDVTERKRAEEESKSLSRLGLRLAGAETVESMITAVREETDHLLGWDAHYFAVRRPEEDAFHVVSFVDTVKGEKKTFRKEDWPVDGLSAPIRPVLEGRPLLINRTPGDPKPVLDPFGDKNRISASLMHVPVRGGDNVIGMLSVQSYTYDRYDEADLQTLQRIADAIAPALERAHAAEALRETEEFSSSLLRNAPIPIIVINPDSSVKYVNLALEQLTGFSSYELIGCRSPYPWWTEETLPKTHKDLGEAMRKGARSLEELFQKKDGKRFWVEITSTAVKENGKLKYYLADWIDITERKRAEKELREAEERFRSLFENVAIGLYRTTPDGRIMMANPALTRMWGYSSFDEVAGRNLEDAGFEPGYPRSVFKELMEREGEVAGLESAWTNRDGTALFVRESARVVRDEAGDILYYEGTVEDVTHRKRAEEALRASEERYRTLVENISLGIALISPDHKIIVTNAAHGRMLHKPRSYFAGKYCFREFEKREAVCPHCPGVQAMATGQPAEVETEGVRDDGSRVPVHIHAFPVFGSEGAVTGFIEVVEDITERKKAEEEKRLLQEQLAEAQKMEALGVLSGGIAHEFNNILAAVIGYTELTLQSEGLSSSARRNLDIVQNSASRGADLTKSLLTFSRKELRERKRLELRNIVDEVLRMTEKEFTTEGIELSVKHSGSVPPVKGDASMLTSVVMNLVINARHAMQSLPVKKLTVQTGLEKGKAFIRVKDTGCGIPEENIHKVFEPFFTTKGSLAGGEVFDRKSRGTGLGLSVCLSIVEGHGGKMKVTSEVGKGTVFTVYLPPASRRKTTRREPQKGAKGKAARIMVVDDEEAIVDLLVDVLDAAGYAAEGFTNPTKALKALRRGRYSLAVIDLQMPEMPGEEFIKKVNGLAPEKRPVTVILTGLLDSLQEDYAALGVFTTVTKPFLTEDVLDIVKRGLVARNSRPAGRRDRKPRG